MLLDKVKPNLIKVDARELNNEADTDRLLQRTAALGVQVVFKRVENPQVGARLQQFGRALGQPVYAQGYLWDTPGASLTGVTASPLSRVA